MTKAEIAEKLANPAPQERPWGTSVHYSAVRDELRLGLDGGTVLVMPRRAIDELRDVPKSHMRELELIADGHALSLRRDDVDIYVPGLVRDLVGFGETATHPNQRLAPRRAAGHAAAGRRVKRR
jgi:hypothetical protein